LFDRMVDTTDNLWKAFAGKSQANRKYTIFAEIAADEGHESVATLFKAAAESEDLHLRCHMRSLAGMRSTEENLEASIEGESYEQTYPEFIAKAKEEGMKEARLCFSYAKKVEEAHEALYREALEAIRSGSEVVERVYFICQVCGNLEVDHVPKSCPVCGNPGEVFREVR